LNINDIKLSSDVFWIGGPDANTYLQGQVSQDLKIPVGGVARGLWLSEKGRVLADVECVHIRTDEWLMVFASDDRPYAYRNIIERNLVADDVEILERTDDFCLLALWGEGTAATCTQLFGALPGAGKFLEREGAYLYGSRTGITEYYHLLIPAAAESGWRSRFDALGAHSRSETDRRRTLILAGEPTFPIELGPDDLPQEGGLEDRLICYTKGCYVGQEVMARLKNMGQIRRRLHVVRGRGPVPPVPAALYQAGRKCGELRSAVPEGEGYVGLAMLTLLAVDPTQAMAFAPEGTAGLTVVRPV